MPNVGKSTLFNALTRTGQAQAANYPFCTIDPNIARVGVPDPRVHALGKMESSQKVIETQLEFVDIAGLVRGASKGEGLGNKFLDNIRQVAVIAHVVRCFEDINILHVEETVDPLRDLDTIQTELQLADLQTVEKRLQTVGKKKYEPRHTHKHILPPCAAHLHAVLKRILPLLEDGIALTDVAFEHPEERLQFDRLQLLTPKKALYLCNVSEDDAATGNAMTEAVRKHVEAQGSVCLNVSGALEEAASQFDDEAGQLEYLECSGLQETGLTQVIRACHELLHLQSYYTVGPQEARAWTIPKGTLAPAAAGVIHSDFERLFIRAETIGFDKLVDAGSMKQARDHGWIRTEGKDYVCQDGDVFHFLVGR
ncbi:hypothetical protein AaE_007167 [Aphanomyces astaci]|uniref:Obg-like ATPase homolog n=1 Tax=Aphanomyces astaci TaxID=112090 RepID=A0A6A5AIV7_APHAT|nr:hypothetical protein AaE_007167 [Aphanomyces astaci]